MRYRGVATCSILAVIMTLVLSLGAHAAQTATRAETNKKPAGRKAPTRPATTKKPAAKKAATAKPSTRVKKPASATAKAAAPAASAKLVSASQPESLATPQADAAPAQMTTQPADSQPASEASLAIDSQPAQIAQSQAAEPQPETAAEPLPLAVLEPTEAEPEEDSPAEPEIAETDVDSSEQPESAAMPQKISLGQATVLGIVEGLTEYLPVSSTGHLILAGYWMGLSHETDEPGVFAGHKIESSQAVDSFEIVIQLGAILAVIGLYRKRVVQMVKGLLGRNPQGLRLAMLLLVAFLPAAVVGLLAHDAIEEHLFGPMPVVVALAVGGVAMIVIERLFWTRRKDRLHAAAQTRAMVSVGASRAESTGPMTRLSVSHSAGSHFTRIDTMLFWQAAVIGLAQCLSLWPGTSRSMVTILAALVVGLDMVAAAEFSFLLALPTLGAATLYSGAKHWDELMQASGPAGLLVGLIVSGIVAAIAVKGFVGWLGRHGLMPFGVYRIVIALILMLYFLS